MRCFALALLLSACGATATDTAPPATSCPAQDARDDGTDCTAVFGYAFDGRHCAPITCGCMGDDCGDILRTKADCEARFASCL